MLLDILKNAYGTSVNSLQKTFIGLMPNSKSFPSKVLNANTFLPQPLLLFKSSAWQKKQFQTPERLYFLRRGKRNLKAIKERLETVFSYYYHIIVLRFAIAFGLSLGMHLDSFQVLSSTSLPFPPLVY